MGGLGNAVRLPKDTWTSAAPYVSSARREVSRGGWFGQRSSSTEGYLDVDGTIRIKRPSRGQPWWVVWIHGRRRHHTYQAPVERSAVVGGLGNAVRLTKDTWTSTAPYVSSARREVSRGGWFGQRSSSTEGYLDVDGTMSFMHAR